MPEPLAEHVPELPNEYVADTHALWWYLLAKPQLGANALAAFRAGEQGTARILIPTIVLSELYYVNAKFGRPLDFTTEIRRIESAAQFRFLDFTVEDVVRFDMLANVPEMHDRIICGTALANGCPCLTKDASITNSGYVPIVW